MSFEGYYQLLCKNGHEDGYDVYWDAPEKCVYCGEEFVWQNMVDVTNGSYCYGWPERDEQCTGCEWCKNGRIDGYIKLEITQEAVMEKCECCGHYNMIEPRRYIIPV